MKRIGLLSDTHAYIDERIIDFLSGCDEIWHAGDIGTLAVLETLERTKLVRAVYGNIDDQKIRSAVPEIQRFSCENTDVLIKHIGGYPGHYDRSIIETIRNNPPKLFISGHSHILKVIYDQKYNLLHINPGAAGKSGIHKVRTLLRFSIIDQKISDLEVVELETR